MRNPIPALLAAALTTAATPATAAPDVTQVVVHGRKLDWSDLARLRSKVPGPAMWKLTRGKGTVWVLAVLDEAPADLKWDDRFLKHVLSGAQTLITPGTATFSPEGEARYRRQSRLPPATSLKAVVSPETFSRLSATVAREKDLKLEAYTGFTAERAGAEVYDNVVSRHGIVEDIPQASQITAMTYGTPIEVLPALRFDGDETVDQLLALDASRNEACLNAYLDGIDYDVDTLPQVARDWAQGDVTEVSLFYRDTPSLSCDLLTAGWQTRFETPAIARMTDAIDKALDRGGQAVALMRFGQLQRKGGILDQLQARGVEVAPAE